MTGFNYQFHALEPQGPPNELFQAISQLQGRDAPLAQAAFRFAQGAFPILKIFVRIEWLSVIAPES